MKNTIGGGREIGPSDTRTNRDKAMIVLGMLIVLLFLILGALSMRDSEQPNYRPKQGPVRHPRTSCPYPGILTEEYEPKVTRHGAVDSRVSLSEAIYPESALVSVYTSCSPRVGEV